MKADMPTRASAWVTVAEGLAHPDHEGVTGDLTFNAATKQYQLQAYNEEMDNYTRYAVPHKWAVKHDLSLPENQPAKEAVQGSPEAPEGIS